MLRKSFLLSFVSLLSVEVVFQNECSQGKFVNKVAINLTQLMDINCNYSFKCVYLLYFSTLQ